jgi:hypothetical protein
MIIGEILTPVFQLNGLAISVILQIIIKLTVDYITNWYEHVLGHAVE